MIFPFQLHCKTLIAIVKNWTSKIISRTSTFWLLCKIPNLAKQQDRILWQWEFQPFVILLQVLFFLPILLKVQIFGGFPQKYQLLLLLHLCSLAQLFLHFCDVALLHFCTIIILYGWIFALLWSCTVGFLLCYAFSPVSLCQVQRQWWGEGGSKCDQFSTSIFLAHAFEKAHFLGLSFETWRRFSRTIKCY